MAAVDIAPELYEKISNEFQRLYDQSAKIAKLKDKVLNKTADFTEAQEYAQEVARIYTAATTKFIRSDVLPGGRLYYNIAERTVKPMLEQSEYLVETVAMTVQKNLNEIAGIKIKAIKPERNADRIQGILDKISDAENFEDVKWLLDSPVENIMYSVVDNTIRENIKFQGRAGLSARLTRTVAFKCCEWCQEVAGTYDYPDVPEDVYRRHENCRCKTTYIPGGGNKYKQDVWSKAKWEKNSEREKNIQAQMERINAKKAEEEAKHQRRLARLSR